MLQDAPSFLTIVWSLFLVMNAVGQIPLFISILAAYEPRKQRTIIIRELIFALGILLIFNFFGDWILKALGITQSIIGIAGGILLFLVALVMIFPKPKTPEGMPQHEPMIVPLAIPVIAGPGAITMTMLYAHKTNDPFMVALALVLAWIPSIIILLVGSFIKYILGDKGLQAVERLGGMLVCLIGIQMFSKGLIDLIKDNFPNL